MRGVVSPESEEVNMNPVVRSPSPPVALHRLRRQATRGLEIVRRHAEQHEIVAVLATTLVPRLQRLIALHDSVASDASGDAEVSEQAAAVQTLAHAQRGWATLVARDVPGFKARNYDHRSPVPDDVIASGHRLVEHIRTIRIDGQPLAYAEAAVASLGPAIAAAEKEWAEARADRAARQQRANELRAAAVEANRELVALRRVLRSVLGARHVDYQAIRNPRPAADVPLLDDVQATVDADETQSEVVVPTLAAPVSSNGADLSSNGAESHAPSSEMSAE
jgi:hypothetical protein